MIKFKEALVSQLEVQKRMDISTVSLVWIAIELWNKSVKSQRQRTEKKLLQNEYINLSFIWWLFYENIINKNGKI